MYNYYILRNYISEVKWLMNIKCENKTVNGHILKYGKVNKKEVFYK